VFTHMDFVYNLQMLPEEVTIEVGNSKYMFDICKKKSHCPTCAPAHITEVSQSGQV